MIWITGRSGSGKTTLASTMDGIHLDGDDMRATISTDLGFSKKDRWENNLRIARLAKLLKSQGFKVVVSTICPYKKLREQVKKITNCKFIHLAGGRTDQPYED